MLANSKIVGILNITPDSFSDGGLEGNTEEIILATQRLINDGADVIDIGAESTRPGATAITHQIEWNRLEFCLPQICNLAKDSGIITSIDTRYAETALKAIECGIDWVNDVSGAGNEEMLKIISSSNVKIVVMHNLGIPSDKNITISEDKNAVIEVKDWLINRINSLENNGIRRERIIIDPGIGFGKTKEQSWDIINNIVEFKAIGLEIMVGHSRKSFLNVTKNIIDMDNATMEVSKKLSSHGVNYLRVHNVAIHKG